MCLDKIIPKIKENLEEEIEKLGKAKTLTVILSIAWNLAKQLAIILVQEELKERDRQKVNWPKCFICGKQIENKGKEKRQIKDIIGIIKFKRKVGYCPNKCMSYRPLDIELEIRNNQRASIRLEKLGCLLAVLLPFGLASTLLKEMFGIKVSSQSIWNWVQAYGLKAWEMIFREMESKRFIYEKVNMAIALLPLVIGADGVMIPFRPNPDTPKGKTTWREIRIGIFARLKQYINKNCKTVTRVAHKRYVAIRGNKIEFQRYMLYESKKHDFLSAKSCAWISDGGKVFWNLYENIFFHRASGILDFYHLAQNAWKMAKIWLDGRTEKAKIWFCSARHRLKHGDYNSVLKDIANSNSLKEASKASKLYKTFVNFSSYINNHKDHINYPDYKQQGLPIGSGIVESTCKYLIQQRFKGSGMRWSFMGFDNLLCLRVAWANDRFDSIFEHYSLRNYPPQKF